MSGPFALLGSLRNAWLLYLSMACALGAGYAVRVIMLQIGFALSVGTIVVICAALSFVVPGLWVLFPALTVLPSYVVSTLALDNSTHNLFGIEVMDYLLMTLLGLVGAWCGQVLRRRLMTVPIYPEHHSRVRTAKNVGGTVLIVGLLWGPVAASLGFNPGGEISKLKWAIQKSDTIAVQAILDSTNTSPNSQSQGWTMLMHAVRSGNSAMVKVLLERGADPNGKGTGGATALTIAAEDGSTDIGRLLLQHQANVNATNANGTTALMYAVENCHKDFVDTLVRAGADLTRHDDDGESAIMIARRRDHTDIVSMLMTAGAKDEKPLSFPDKRLTQSLCKRDSGSRHP